MSLHSLSARVLIPVVVAAWLTVGCRSVPAGPTAALHRAASQLATDTTDILARLEDLALETSVRRAAHSTNELLSPADFAPPITAKAKASLLAQLDAVESYCAMLRSIGAKDYRGKLADPAVAMKAAFNHAATSANELGKFGSAEELKQIQQTAGTIAGATAAVGEIFIDARIQAQTRRVIQRFHPDFDRYLHSLADIFSKTNDVALAPKLPPSLAAVLENEFQDRIGSSQRDWLSLGTAPAPSVERAAWESQRRDVARSYISMVRSKELSPALAVGLRNACLGIAKSHGALLEEGRGFDFADLESAVAQIRYLKGVFENVQNGSSK